MVLGAFYRRRRVARRQFFPTRVSTHELGIEPEPVAYHSPYTETPQNLGLDILAQPLLPRASLPLPVTPDQDDPRVSTKAREAGTHLTYLAPPNTTVSGQSLDITPEPSRHPQMDTSTCTPFVKYTYNSGRTTLQKHPVCSMAIFCKTVWVPFTKPSLRFTGAARRQRGMFWARLHVRVPRHTSNGIVRRLILFFWLESLRAGFLSLNRPEMVGSII